MKFFDDKSKNVKWWNRNYFYIGTIAIILVNILLFKFLGNSWENSIVDIDGMSHWDDMVYLNPTIVSFFNSFSHANWQHVLLNMLCFAVCGFYLERKTGSLGMVGLVLFGAYVSSVAITGNDLSVGWHGFSGVNYFLYAYVILDFLFSFAKTKRNKTNIIIGAILIVLICVAMCFSGGVSGFEFKPYPYDLLHNCGHYCGFLIGFAIGLFKNIIELSAKHSVKRNI